MKKILAAIAIAAMLSIASSAMASGAKMPKLLCLDWSSWYQQLSFKAIGTIYIDGAKVKTYAINGTDFYGRTLTGTAYIVPGTTTLYASYNTNYVFITYSANGGYELTFDLATGTGTVYYGYDGPEINLYGDTGVGSTDCQAASIMAMPETVTPDMAASAGMR